MNVTGLRWIDVPFSRDGRGDLSVIERATTSFTIKRLFYMHRVPGGVARGGHAHPYTQQLVVPVAGQLRLKLSDGIRWDAVSLDDPNRGLFLPRMTWTELLDFSESAVTLVVCDTEYVATDVIRTWDAFLAAAEVHS